MKIFTLLVRNDKGEEIAIDVPVAKCSIQNLTRDAGLVEREALLTLKNHMRLQIPVTEEQAKWLSGE